MTRNEGCSPNLSTNQGCSPNITELKIEESKHTGSLIINGVPPDLHKSPEKIKALLDLLEMPKGTKVTVNFQASSSIVR